MIEWTEMCEVTRKKLDRELLEKEIDFLKWVYEMHVKEVESNPESN